MSAKPESLMCDSRVRGSVPPTCEARDSAAISPPVEIDLDGVTGFTRSKSISTGGGPRDHGGGATPSQFSNMGSAIFLTTVPWDMIVTRLRCCYLSPHFKERQLLRLIVCGTTNVND